MQIEARARKWGDSIGFIIPSEIVKKEGISQNSKVLFEIQKVTNISDTFGKLKRKESGQQFKDNARRGWNNA